MAKKKKRLKAPHRYVVLHTSLMDSVDEAGWVSNEFAHIRVAEADYIVERVNSTVSMFEAHRMAYKGLENVYDFTKGKKARAILTFDDEVYII